MRTGTDTLRAIMAREQAYHWMVGTVIGVDPRGPRDVTVRVSGGRVWRQVSTCVQQLEVGDQVMVMRTKDRDRPVIIGKIASAVSSDVSRSGVLAPPDGFVAYALSGAVMVEWESYPGEDLCYEIERALQADKSDALTVLIARGNYYIYGCAGGTTVYCRIRAIRWLGDNNVAYSSWSAWVDETADDAGVETFLELTDTPADYTGQALRGLRVNAGENALEFTNITDVDEFTDLSDTPANYTGSGGKVAAVKDIEDGLEFVDVGELSDFDHTHVEGDITDLDHDAAKIQGRAVASDAPSDGQALVWDSVASEWTPGDVAASGGGGGGGSEPVFRVDGALSAVTDLFAYVVTGSLSIEYVYIYCDDPGSAGSTIVDVHKNGTTVFTTQGNRPTLAYDDADQVAKGTPDVVSVEELDVLTVDIDQVATGAEGLTVEIAFSSDSADTFLGLTDTPAAYTDKAGYLVAVNDAEDALELILIGSLSDIIAGSLSDLWPSDAEDLTYTPAVAADWDSDTDPGDLDDALDQLAERVDDLEAGGGGGGDSTYTAAYASRPAASNDGDLFLPSDGFQIERDTGAAWVPWGPIFPLAGVASAPSAWINQGPASTITTNGGLTLLAPATGAANNIRILKKSAPSTPYVITAAFLANTGAAEGRMMLVWRQSSDGKLVVFRFQGSNVKVTKLTNPTTFSADYLAEAIGLLSVSGPLCWMRIADNGSNRICSLSGDGINFVAMHSVGRTDFLTADEVGIGVNPYHATRPASMTLLSWQES